MDHWGTFKRQIIDNTRISFIIYTKIQILTLIPALPKWKSA